MPSCLQMPTLRQLLYMALELVVFLLIVGSYKLIVALIAAILYSIILLVGNTTTGTHYTLSMIDWWKWALPLVGNLPLAVLNAKNAILRLREYFNVDRSEEEILSELDQLLQLSKTIQRFVEGRLAAGASRDDLRTIEEAVVHDMDILTALEVRYESNRLCKLKYRVSEFMFKIAQISAVCERIAYLCRPAVGA